MRITADLSAPGGISDTPMNFLNFIIEHVTDAHLKQPVLQLSLLVLRRGNVCLLACIISHTSKQAMVIWVEKRR